LNGRISRWSSCFSFTCLNPGVKTIEIERQDKRPNQPRNVIRGQPIFPINQIPA
jgi:hypothetical protein